MPKITNIEPQKKQKNRYSIFIDGRYRFSLTELDLVDADLSVGQSIEPARVEELLDLSGYNKIFKRAQSFLAYRLRSRKEVFDYLKRKSYSLEEIDKTIAKLEGDDYIDDARFAREWIASRQASKPRSANQLRRELRQKGIDAEIVDDALKELSQPDETQLIRDLIERKNLLGKYKNQSKLVAYLAAKGFKYSDIKLALEDVD